MHSAKARLGLLLLVAAVFAFVLACHMGHPGMSDGGGFR
jgi:hypothetical protein